MRREIIFRGICIPDTADSSWIELIIRQAGWKPRFQSKGFETQELEKGICRHEYQAFFKNRRNMRAKPF
jgi:hypothetical protein